jgi:hypothetical protein
VVEAVLPLLIGSGGNHRPHLEWDAVPTWKQRSSLKLAIEK